MLGQKFSSLEYSNCWDLIHAPMPMQVYYLYKNAGTAE